MNFEASAHINKASQSSALPVRAILQRKSNNCCGQRASATCECSGCKNKRTNLQTHAETPSPLSGVPSLAGDVLQSSGRPLEPSTRSFMESRFGQDFSQVRVHTDETAARSARSMNSLAYTVGNDIAFGKDQYAPDNTKGKRILAHELTHVLQQKTHKNSMQTRLSFGEPADTAERQADDVADAVVLGIGKVPSSFAPAMPSIQRACGVADIGTRTECNDQDPVFLTGHPVFKFNANCDDFAPGEEANLNTTAGTLTGTGPVEIHGYASVDGNATFNENLSCARALKARTTLSSAGVTAGRISVIKHGPTPGPAEDRRSVVISSPAAPGPTPPTPTPTPPTPTPAPPRPSQVITSQTVATSPGVRTRTTIGVGEEVNLTFSAGNATWATTGGQLSTATGPQSILTAPDTAQIVGVAAVGAGTATITFTVIAPTTVSMDREPGTGVKHTLNQPNSGIQTRVHLGRDNVNFYNLIFRERDVPGVPTNPGVYSCNTFSTGHCSGAVAGACPDKAMTNTVIAGMGTRSLRGDCAYSGHCGTAAPFVPGSITVTIPYEYKIGTGAFHHIVNVPQVHALAADATTLTSDKAGAHGTTTVAAATTVIAACP